jgi:transcriptional regulator with XRE-family HTH domain
MSGLEAGPVFAREFHGGIPMDDDRLGARLRAERERRKIALEHVAANTKIGISLLRDLERDDLSRWPTGIFRRSFVRAYAQAIGVDPDDTLERFLSLYPDPPEYSLFEQSPLARGSSAAALAKIARAERPARTAGPGAFRLALADEPHPFMAGRLLRGPLSRIAAAMWDVATPTGLALVVYLLLDRFWIPLGVIMAAYHAGSVLALGNTPGVYFFAPTEMRRGDSSPESDLTDDLASDSVFHPREV